MAKTELTEPKFPLNFRDDFRPMAEEKLREDMAQSGIDWGEREKSQHALTTLTEDEVGSFITSFGKLMKGRMADVILLPQSQNNYWKEEVRIVAEDSHNGRVAKGVDFYFTSDHLFEILYYLEQDGHVRMPDKPEEWEEWYARDRAYRGQEDAKAKVA